MGQAFQWERVTAILGGRFDPPHFGHVEAAKGLLTHPRVARVLVVPAASPAHKPARASAEVRLEMVTSAFEDARTEFGKERFEISELEIQRSVRTGGAPTYSFDTLMELRRETPDLAFALGTDQWAGIQSWHRFPEVLQLCHWIILSRRESQGIQCEEEARQVLKKLEGQGLIRQHGGDGNHFTIRTAAGPERWIQIVPTQAPEASSTAIREAIQMGPEAKELPQNVQRTLPKKVWEVIVRKGLYGYRPQKK